MSLQISPFGNTQFFDTNGQPASGYQLFIYLSGTSTKAVTYTDINGVGQQQNPILLNTSGRPMQPIYIDVSVIYKFVLASPTDTDPPTSPLYTVDGVSAGIQGNVTLTPEWTTGTTPTYISGTQFSVVGDQTLTYTVGRRVKAVLNSGSYYGTITATLFGAGVTTVTLLMDAGSLDNTISTVSYAFLSASGSSWPAGYTNGLTTNLAGPLVIPLFSGFNIISVGFMAVYAGTSPPPAGWLVCNGQAVSRTTYSALFGAIGTVFGTGDGATTFNVPNVSGPVSNTVYVIRYA